MEHDIEVRLDQLRAEISALRNDVISVGAQLATLSAVPARTSALEVQVSGVALLEARVDALEAFVGSTRRHFSLAPHSMTIVHGHRYSAQVHLSGFEEFASNDHIASMMTGYGFTQVSVTGSGGVREAVGTWMGATKTGSINSHLSNIRSIG